MNLSVGIVGLPNVGKSTLFNALLKKQQALAANYPFATIEPNVGVVPVPDERLEVLADIIAKGSSTSEESEVSKKRPPIVPATVKFVDIAGLVKGASEGAGLGNKFLSHIREVSVIAHVVRAFEDPHIIKEGLTDPKSDYETITTELILADLQTLENSKVKKERSKVQIKSQKGEIVEKLKENLDKGISARNVQLTEEERESIKDLFLLSAKPEILVLNVSENDYSEEKFDEIYSRYTSISSVDRMVVVCAKIESDLSELSEEEQKQYLQDIGIKQSGLERLIQKAYETLGLISFLTAGEKEVRAWTITKGTKALDAAGVIHTDFTKKFIKAEVVSFHDFVQFRGWKGSQEFGKTKLEGKEYAMQDGDVVEFKIGA